jgi:hypothetical protein
MDEELTVLFRQWLTAFEKTQSTTDDEETVAALALSKIESRIAATPAEGLRGLVVKLGLQRFLHEHADGSGEQAEFSPSCDLKPSRGFATLSCRSVEALHHFY